MTKEKSEKNLHSDETYQIKNFIPRIIESVSEFKERIQNAHIYTWHTRYISYKQEKYGVFILIKTIKVYS